MTEYTYTDSFVPGSQLVDIAYYNKGDKKLFVSLAGNFYGYSGFPIEAWEEFATSTSAGSYFNFNIKGQYLTLDVKNATLRYIGDQESPYTFIIEGHTPVKYELKGRNLEEAREDFARLFPEGILQKVEVKFE